MNKMFLTGNLTAAPEMRALASGTNACTFTIAVDRKRPDKNGNRVTDFFRINTFGKIADSCYKYLEKGKKVGVVGELHASQFTDKNGKSRISLDVSCDEVEFLTPKGTPAKDTADDLIDAFSDVSNEDIPF